jgi:hypothetical protein
VTDSFWMNAKITGKIILKQKSLDIVLNKKELIYVSYYW